MQPSLTRVKAVRDFHVGPRHELIVKTGDEFDVELLENDRFFVKSKFGTFGECYIGHGWIKTSLNEKTPLNSSRPTSHLLS